VPRPTLRSVGRGELAALFALLLALSTAVAFNYERNLRKERAARPYHVYDDRELGRLISAYRAEVQAWEARHRSARGIRPGAGAGIHLDERVQDFERAQRAGSRERGAAGELAEREGVLRDLEAEQRARSQEGPELGRFVRRLVAL
jgi:hypothetical protein